MFRRWMMATVLVGATATVLSATSPMAAVPGDKPVRVLFVLGSPPSHDIRKLPPILEAAMNKAGGFKVERLEPPADKPPNDAMHLDKLAMLKPGDYDVLVFYTVGYKLNEVQERAILRFVEDGGGLVAIHGASASFGNSQVWMQLVGGKFAGHIAGTHALKIVPTDTKHPITTGIEPFTIVDEEYNHNFAKVDRKVIGQFAERPKGSKGMNNDILWTRDVGKGRVFYTGLGHGKEAWEHPSWQKMMMQGISWSAGKPREVKWPQ